MDKGQKVEQLEDLDAEAAYKSVDEGLTSDTTDAA